MVQNKKLVVWDLCGGSQNSVFHSMNGSGKYEIYTFDINEKLQHEKQFVVDLTREDVVEYLEKNFPRPDIIVASPNCAAFSVINNCGKKARIAINADLEIRSIEEIDRLIKERKGFFQYRKAETERNTAIIGCKLAKNVVEIIQHFNPKYWYIENPQSSLMWDFFDKKCDFMGYKNLAFYNNYDTDFSPKNTYFMSNVKMDLKHKRVDNTYFKENKGARSHIYKNGKTSKNSEQGSNVKIPYDLIKHIFSFFNDENK